MISCGDSQVWPKAIDSRSIPLVSDDKYRLTRIGFAGSNPALRTYELHLISPFS